MSGMTKCLPAWGGFGSLGGGKTSEPGVGESDGILASAKPASEPSGTTRTSSHVCPMTKSASGVGIQTLRPEKIPYTAGAEPSRTMAPSPGANPAGETLPTGMSPGWPQPTVRPGSHHWPGLGRQTAASARPSPL
jgi:hypothetical protein